MSLEPQIEFVLQDRVDGVEITPSSIGLSRFNEFNQQVETFIAGAEKLRVDDVRVQVAEGSYKIVGTLPEATMRALEPDLHRLERQDSLGEIDPKRAEVVGKWQARSKGSADLQYRIHSVGSGISVIRFNRNTDYRVGEAEPWVKVEKYLFGTVVDMGGVGKVNVQIKLEDSGQVVRIGSNQGYLKEHSNDRLYHKVLVRVEADQHYRTGVLRNLRLLAFENYAPGYDEAALDRFAEAGRKAWAGVPDGAAWVRELRGGAA